MSKLLERTMDDRIRAIVEEEIGEERYGFRKEEEQVVDCLLWRR